MPAVHTVRRSRARVQVQDQEEIRMAASEAIRQVTSSAIVAAQEFSEIYHETFDKRRQAVSKMYQDKAQLVWNGNAFKGVSQISEFFDKLPESVHTVDAMDTQALLADTVGSDASSIVVTFCGMVKFKSETAKMFNQTIILSYGDKWEITSDNYRFHE